MDDGPVFVRCPDPLHTANLRAWGRAPDGWYGYVWWWEHVFTPTQAHGMITMSGWWPAEVLTPFFPTVSSKLRRVMLDGQSWPGVLPSWATVPQDHCVGLLRAGEQAGVPEGFERLVTVPYAAPS